MKLKDLIKVIFGEDMKFAEVKIAGSEAMLKADGEDFVVGQPIYLVEPGREPVIIDSEAEFILEDGRKIETGSDGTITEISTESIEDAVEVEEEEMAKDPEMKEKKEMEDMPEGEKKEEDKEEMGEYKDKKEQMEDPMKSLSDRIDELTSKLDNIQKSLPENMMEEMEKMKKEIKMLKNEPIAEKFEAENISNPVKSNDFKSYLITLQKNIN